MDNIFSSVSSFLRNAVERFTQAFKVISTDHAYIHNGIGFRASGASTSISAGASYFVSITTGNSGKYVHMRPALFASTANLLQISIMENATISGGTAVPVINQNRNSENTSIASVKTGVSIATAGDVEVGFYLIGSGGTPSAPKASGSTGSDNEILLKPNKTYSIEFKNIGSSTATIGYFNLFWYEETSGL